MEFTTRIRLEKKLESAFNTLEPPKNMFGSLGV